MLNLRMLLVIAAICAALGYAIFNQFPDSLLEAIIAGGFAFVGSFSVLATLQANANKRRLAAIESGMRALETSMDKRLNALTAKSAEQDEFELRHTQVAASENGKEPKLDSEIELNSATVEAKKQKPHVAASLHKLANGSANGHADEPYKNGSSQSLMQGELCLHLQPIVDVANRNTFGFQVVPAYRDATGEISYIDYSQDAEFPATLWNPRLDLQILSKSLLLVRKLRQKAPHVLVFIPFSGSIFSDKRMFKQLKQEIDANRALAEHCVLCVDADTWQQIDKPKRAHIVDLLDIGFQAAIRNCPAPTKLKKSLKLDQFSFFFASVTDLGIDTAGQPNGTSAALQHLAAEHNFKIVVSKVRHDYELIRLVDEDFPFAIGEYLSPAKAPNL